MSTLHDRLADLADDAHEGPDAGQQSGGELWDRGRRYARLRRRGTAAVTALGVLAVVAVGAVSWQRAAPPADLAPASAPAAMPDELFVPSPWLPGTEEAGPLGRLAAIIPADRGSWTGTEMEVVGVSATTGEYRFLDLPDLYAPPGAALSPDGRHVAYWATGEPTGTPHDSEGPVTAVAVYDAASGEVERYDIATEHGLSTEDLVWTGAGSLVVVASQWSAGEDEDPVVGGARLMRWQLLRLGEGLVPLDPQVRDSWVAGSGPGTVVLDAGSHQLVVDTAGNAPPTRLRLQRWMGELRLSPDGSRAAGVPGNQLPGPLGVAEVASGRQQRVPLEPVPGGVRDRGRDLDRRADGRRPALPRP